MVAAIPDKRKLGRLPGLADTPMVSAPRDTLSPAIQNFGQALQGLGKQVAYAQQEDVEKLQKAQQYEVTAATDRFQSEQRVKANERVRDMQPGGGGLVEGFDQDNTKATEAFIATQPEWIRPQVSALLNSSNLRLREGLIGKRDDEAHRFAKVQFDKDDGRRIGETVDAMREAQTPEEMRAALDAGRKKAIAFSDAVPELSEIERQALRDGADGRFAAALADRLQRDPELAKRFYGASQGVGVASGGQITSQARQTLSSVLAKDKDASHIDGMKPRFANSLASMIESAPAEIRRGLGVMSGHRSVERQQQLWDASDKTGRTVARPGGSRHNHGDAADLTYNGQRLDKAPQAVRDWVRDNAPKHGLGLPMDYEPWHIEDFEARSADNPMGAQVRRAVAGARPDLMAGSAANRAREFPALTPQQFFGSGVDVASLPAGMRNNNPGNIKYVRGSSLPGIVGPSQNTDQGDPQAVFSSPQAGMTAMAQLALRKFDGGKTTVGDLIAAQGGWTPGNNEAANSIARKMGVGVGDRVNLRDPAQLQKFMRAVISQEHGAPADRYDDKLIADAASAASSGEPVTFGAPGSAAGPAYGAPRPDAFGSTRAQFASLFPNAPDTVVTTLTERTLGLARAAEQEEKRQSVKRFGVLYNQLQNDILDGRAGMADIEAARQSWLTDADKAKAAMGWVEQRDKDQMESGRALDLLAAGQKLNPYDTDDRKLVDKAYSALTGKEVDPAKLQASAEQVTQTLGVAPQSYINGIRAGILSRDPATALSALQQGARLQQMTPTALERDGGDDIRKNAVAFRHLVNDLGFSETAAAERIMAANDPNTRKPVSRDDAEKAAKKITLGEVAGAFDQSILPFNDPESGFTPGQKDALVGDYRELFRTFYEESGDPAIAKAAANDQFKKLYAPTYVSGSGVVMKYPPEKSYPAVGDGHAWLGEQALEAAREASGRADLKPENLALIATPQTAAEIRAKAFPSYMMGVVTKDANGFPKLDILRNGVQFRFDPKAAQAKETERNRIIYEERRAIEEPRRQIREEAIRGPFDPAKVRQRFEANSLPQRSAPSAPAAEPPRLYQDDAPMGSGL